MTDFFDTILGLLHEDGRFFAADGTLLRNAVFAAAMSMDKTLIHLLLSNDDTRGRFFTEVDGVMVFDKMAFGWVINSRQFLKDSYTRYKNKIGLVDETGELISATGGVELVFPYKDCVLEGGQTKEEQKRGEIFYNTLLAPEEVDKLLYPKVFTHAVRYTAEGKTDLAGEIMSETITVKEEAAGELRDSDNLVIKGNNLLVISSLLRRYEGQVKCIYIDPPYNTGGDSFGYNDKFNHSSWLVFMKNRLEIARRLLRDDGAIFVQCDDNEQAYLKVLMDELWCKENKLSTITVKVKAPAGVGQETCLFDVTETILVYAKNYKHCNINAIKEKTLINEYTFNQYSKILQIKSDGHKIATLQSAKNGEIDLMQYDDYVASSIQDDNRCEKFYKDNLDCIIETTNPQGGLMKKILPSIPKKGLYSITYSPSKGEKFGDKITYYFLDGRIVIWLNKSIAVENDRLYKLSKMTNLWTDNIFQGMSAEGGVTMLNGKKPEALISRIIEISTSPHDLVMDFYVGSGTTAAVAHKMGRRYVCVEQMDYIGNIPVPRMEKVLSGEQGGVSKQAGWHGGGSFVYCELFELNQRTVSQIEAAEDDDTLEAIKQRMLETGFISHDVLVRDIDNTAEDFAALSIKDKKRLLMDLLDMNLLYVNLCDMDDEEYEVSEADKRFTRSVYREDVESE